MKQNEIQMDNLCELCIHKPICKYKESFVNSLVEIFMNKNINTEILEVTCKYWVNKMCMTPPPKK